LYQQAGVDIEEASDSVKRITALARGTYNESVLSEIGGFSGLFHAGGLGFKDLVLASGADGVGTKVLISQAMDKHDTVGIDLVAMNVDDVVTCGARPLFFLDYLAVGRLNRHVVTDLVKGITDGCRQAGCVLLGGETAQMPDIYGPDEYDLAGFCVGGVERDRIIDGSKIRPGDVIIGLGSSGVHSNGYTLVRKVLLEQAKLDLDKNVPEFGRTLGEELLEPTKIYAPVIVELCDEVPVKGLAHVTGGGIPGNVSRIIPHGMRMRLCWDWPVPAVFDMIQELGKVPQEEMRTVFNMGIGMVVIVGTSDADRVLSLMKARGIGAHLMGEVESDV
jgi:phosphoribosylformylglycinamidine cyclo-ligase